MSNTVTAVIRGKASYAKILGDPIGNPFDDTKAWKLDLELTDKNSLKELKALGISSRVKNKEEYLNGNPFVTFKQKELNSKGEPNKPIKVVDVLGKPWDQDKLIGNGSVVDVKFQVRDYGVGKPKGVYVNAIRILDLVPYEGAGGGFEALSEDDEYFAKASAALDLAETAQAEDPPFDLDDDLDDIA